MNNSPPSVSTLAFAMGLGSAFFSVVIAIILVAKDVLTWGGVWTSCVNCFVAGGLAGLMIGTLYNISGRIAEGSRILSAILVTLMMLLVLAIAIAVPILTSHRSSMFIWQWNR